MTKRPRILWLSNATDAHTVRWISALAERDVEVALFSLVAPESDWVAELGSVTLETAEIGQDLAYYKNGGLRKIRYLSALSKIRRLAADFAPDLVHAHYCSSYGVLASLAGLRPRIVSVWGADIYETPNVSGLHRQLIRWVLKTADAVTSTSHTMREQALTVYQRRIAVIPFGIDVARFSPAYDSPRDDSPLTIGTVKRLEKKYGLEYLLEAYSQAVASRPDRSMRLLIVGGGSYMARLNALAEKLGISDQTTFTGQVRYADVHLHQQDLDIAVYPSIDDSESFGVSAIESQACGVPVVVSDAGGLPEVVEKGETGLVVARGNAEELAAALLELIDSPSKRQAFGAAGRQHVVNNYSLDACVDKLLGEYRKLATSIELSS